MRNYVVFLILVCSANSFAQKSKIGDTLRPGPYDTTMIEIASKISFPFCSNTYALPRDCEGNLPPNCCHYYTQLEKNEKITNHGFISCSNGSALSWDYYGSLESAKQNNDGTLPQWKDQQKEFTVKKIKCIVMDKESEAYMIEMGSFTGYKSYILLTYGTYNGYTFTLEYRSRNKVSSNEDIQPFIRQIIRLQ